MNLLITGGAGYIGSHTAIALMEQGHEITIVDNFCNAKPQVIDRINKIAGTSARFFQADICDRQFVENLFKTNRFDAVIHFAGLKAVGESVNRPLKYYHNNVAGSLVLLENMDKYDVKNLIFSSSATVYGEVDSVPIKEDAPLGTANPYGRTKWMIEEMITDVCDSDPCWNATLLRYFNPIGAHKSGYIGEDPEGIPNNLMPYITQVAAGKLEKLNIYGDDYPTPDGTGVRDYIHVVDLAEGHVKALEKTRGATGCRVYNLGTGIGYSVLEVVKAFETATGIAIPYEIMPRREGDIAVCYADTSKASKELGWQAKYSLEDMCRHAWNWQKNNVKG